MIPMSLAELRDKAALVVHGRVLDKIALRDARGRIYTEVTLGAGEIWKGTVAGDRLTIVLVGGVIGEDRTFVPGQADYRVGEEVVAFLRLNQRGEAVTIGLAQGKFEVWSEAATGRKFARNLFLGRPQPAGSKSQLQAQAEDGRLALEDLKRQVQGGAQ
jgi:hypothetical protein